MRTWCSSATPCPLVYHTDSEVPVDHRCADMHLARIGELDGVPDQMALFVAEADRQGPGNIGLERERLGFCQCLGCRARSSVRCFAREVWGLPRHLCRVYLDGG